MNTKATQISLKIQLARALEEKGQGGLKGQRWCKDGPNKGKTRCT